MLLYLNAFITLLVPFLLGAAVFSAVLQKKLEFFAFWEKLALSFALGWGMHTIIMFLLSIMKIPLTFANIVLADLVVIVPLLPFSRNILASTTRKEESSGIWLPVISYCLFAVIGIKTLLVFWSSYLKPVIDPDI